MPRRPTPTPRKQFGPPTGWTHESWRAGESRLSPVPALDINAELAAGCREVERGRELAPDEPSVLACNRCNAERAPSVHPCPECRCPEYRILPPR